MFEREGLAKINTSKEVSEDLLGVNTYFRTLVELVVKKAVDSGKWFSFCKKIKDSQYDVMSFKNEQGISLGHLIRDYFQYTEYRPAIYKYLLMDYLCYVEVPVKGSSYKSGYTQHFDKFLATSNLEVVAKWLGVSLEEANRKYGSRIEECVIDNECDLYPYLKLYETKSERKVTKPRKDIDLGKAGTRVIPLFALEEGMKHLYNAGKKDYLRVSFCKDNGQERKMDITFDIGKIRNIYGDSDFFRRGVENQWNGNFIENPNLGRGYIRVFELGGSIYDAPTRSINYARILDWSVLEATEIDTSLIHVDLDKVQDTFVKGIRRNYKELHEVLDMMKIFELKGMEGVKTVGDLERWCDSQITLLSTVFLRKLALFIIGSPQWFDSITSESNVGSEESDAVVDFDDDIFDLDLDMEVG